VRVHDDYAGLRVSDPAPHGSVLSCLLDPVLVVDFLQNLVSSLAAYLLTMYCCIEKFVLFQYSSTENSLDLEDAGFESA
jgi:hypothetical protein